MGGPAAVQRRGWRGRRAVAVVITLLVIILLLLLYVPVELLIVCRVSVGDGGRDLGRCVRSNVGEVVWGIRGWVDRRCDVVLMVLRSCDVDSCAVIERRDVGILLSLLDLSTTMLI